MIKGITIHNSNSDKTAKELREWAIANKATNICHYLVDDTESLQITPESEMAYHTGMGYDFGNRYTLAIEICRSRSDEPIYKKAENNAVKLIKRLMKKYGLSPSDIYFHSDFDPQMRCPHRILEHMTKEEFINEHFLQG